MIDQKSVKNDFSFLYILVPENLLQSKIDDCDLQ